MGGGGGGGKLESRVDARKVPLARVWRDSTIPEGGGIPCQAFKGMHLGLVAGFLGFSGSERGPKQKEQSQPFSETRGRRLVTAPPVGSRCGFVFRPLWVTGLVCNHRASGCLRGGNY